MRNDHIPGMRRWRKNRKQLFLILAAMSLCFFLIEMTFLFSDSLELTMQEAQDGCLRGVAVCAEAHF